MTAKIPHMRVVVAFCVAAMVCYAFFSVYVVLYSGDAALRGDVVGTWKSFAVAVMSFWVGSSSGGKQQATEPTPVKVENTGDEPVPVEAR